MFPLNHSCLCFRSTSESTSELCEYMHQMNMHQNEYIIFCKEHKFKSKKNKSRLPLQWVTPQEAKAIVYLDKGL